MTEGSESLTSLNSVELGQDGVMLSPEDIAWADSCLSKDPDMLDSGWNSVKAALLETLDPQNHSFPYERGNSPEEDKMEIFPSGNTGNTRNIEEKSVISIAVRSDGADSVRDSYNYASLETPSTHYHSSPYDRDDSPMLLQPPDDSLIVLQPPDQSSYYRDDVNDSNKTTVSIAAASEGEKLNGDDHLNHENADDFWSRHKTEDVFLPTYNENLRDLGLSDPEVDLVFQEFQVGQSTEDIFKIWDLDIPAEENDLTKQLNKALAENSLEPTTPVSDDSEAWKGQQDESLDDLISGIADLTLSPNSD